MAAQSRSDRRADQLAAHVGTRLRDERRRRELTLRQVSERSGRSIALIHDVEHGKAASLDSYARLASALNLELTLDLTDPRRRQRVSAEDPVHAWMGEVIAARMRGWGYAVGLDEPFQHYQFAGRADVVAWDLATRALLHVENRTRFPNLQDALGSYNAKRRYLPAVLAERLGLRRGWDSVTNVIAALWSAEALHDIRLRPASFAAVCPDPMTDFAAWWAGHSVTSRRPTSALVLIDPAANRRSDRRQIIDLETAIRASTRPRYPGYADAAEVAQASWRR